MADVCADDRFEKIAYAKRRLIDATNIETSKDEMKVLDSFLFRLWQMGWIDKALYVSSDVSELQRENKELIKIKNDLVCMVNELTEKLEEIKGKEGKNASNWQTGVPTEENCFYALQCENSTHIEPYFGVVVNGKFSAISFDGDLMPLPPDLIAWQKIEPYKKKGSQMTNFEKLKAMTIEERDNLFGECTITVPCNCCAFYHTDKCKDEGESCIKGFFRWLNQEAEDRPT